MEIIVTGRQRLPLDFSGVPSGTYFLRAIVGDNVESLPITIVR